MPLGGAIAIGAGSAIGGLLGGAGGKAQASAAKYAANLQYQLGQKSLDFQNKQFNTTQANIAPFLKAGTSSINTLADLLKNPGSGLLTPWAETFKAPTAADAAATPGYQFAAGAGSGAIQNSAAASGNLLSTGTLKTLDQFNQGLASTTYSDSYNRSFNEYLTRYNQFQGNQTNEFNRLASVAGVGQTSANTLATSGQNAAGNVAGINASTGAQVGGSSLAAGGATASGYASLANAINGGIGGIVNNSQSNNLLALLQQIYGIGGGGGGYSQSQLAAPGSIPAATNGTVIPS